MCFFFLFFEPFSLSVVWDLKRKAAQPPRLHVGVNNVFVDVDSPVSFDCSAILATMETSSSELSSANNTAQSASAVSSTVGWYTARVNAMNSLVMRGTTWHDAASFSSPHLLASPLCLVTRSHRVPMPDAARVTTKTGPSLSSSELRGDCTSTAIVSLTNHAALVKGVNGFREFIAQLPICAPIPACPDARGDEEPLLGVVGATQRPQLSHTATVTAAGTPPDFPSATTQVPESESGSPKRNSESPAQLLLSTVPSHCVRPVVQNERSHSLSSVTPLMSDISASSFSSSPRQRVCLAAEAPKVKEQAKSELAQTKNGSDSGFTITAVRRERELGSLKNGKAASEEVESRPSTISFVQASPAFRPDRFFSDPPSESTLVATKTAHIVISNRDTRGDAALPAREAFQQYLDQTRKTVLNAQASEEERAKAFDELSQRSRQLFDLLDGMHTSLVDIAERRRHSLVKVPPSDGMVTPLSNVDPPVRPFGRAGNTSPSEAVSPMSPSTASAAAAVTTSTTSDEASSSTGNIEPLTLTTRTYTAQLTPFGQNGAFRLLNSFERGRRCSFNSCSTNTSVTYLDIVNNYCIIRMIGIGATGRAYLVLDRRTNKYYAMKTVAKCTRRTAARQFPFRPPSSPSERSVVEQVGLTSSVPDNTAKLLAPRRVASVAASAVQAPVVSADGTLSSSVSCTTRPAAAADVVAAETAKQADIAGPDSCSNASEQALQEADTEGLGSFASHPSCVVIPYVESVTTSESSSVLAADGTTHDNTVKAALIEEGTARSARTVRQSSSFAVKTTTATVVADALQAVSKTTNGSSSSNCARPPMTPSSLRALASGVIAKDKSAGSPAVELSAVEREIRVMRRLQNHVHVARLKEVIDDDEEDCLHLVMTYAANGPLTTVHGYDTVRGCAACDVVRPFSRCARLLRQLADALIYVHRQRIVHNDVKPDNILLTESDNVLLTDFGESVLVPKRVQSTANTPQQQQQQQQQQQCSPQTDNLNATVNVPFNRWQPSRMSGDSWLGSCGGFAATLNGFSQLLTTEASYRLDSSMFLAAGVDGDGRLHGDRIIVGSPAFAAPELIDSSTCSYESDTWSFGVVLYAVVFGRLPFAGPSISDTFHEILHAPLTFPPLEAVPENAELTEAAYDLWVRLCSRLLVREPQQRLSLRAMLRHPLFRRTLQSSTSLKLSNVDALSMGCRSVSSCKVLPDSPAARRRSAQSRHAVTQDDAHDNTLSPVSRTISPKPSSDVAAPPPSVSTETLSRADESPTPFPGHVFATGDGSGSGTVHAPPPPSAAQASTAKTAAVILAAVPTPPCVGSAAVACAPLPSSLLSTAPKRTSIPAVKCIPASALPTLQQSDDSVSALVLSDQNSITQPPSQMPMKGTDTMPPSFSSATDDAATALPTLPQHVRESTLAYVQSSDSATSGRTASLREGPLFPMSNRCYGECRCESATHTPVSAALMVDSAPVPRLLVVSKSGSPPLLHAAYSTQTFEKEEMRRLGLASRESTLVSTSLRTLARTGNEDVQGAAAVGPAPHPTTALVVNGRSPTWNEARDEGGDHAARDIRVSGVTHMPQDDNSTSARVDDASNCHEEETDYFSYWNNSESDAASSEEAELLAETTPPPDHAGGGPHAPHDSQPPTCRRHVPHRPPIVPVLTNQEEVPGRHMRWTRSVVQTKRRKTRWFKERRPSNHPLLQGCEQTTTKPSDDRKEGPRRTSDDKCSSFKSASRVLSPAGGKRHSNSTSAPEMQVEEPKDKQPSGPKTKPWFKRCR